MSIRRKFLFNFIFLIVLASMITGIFSLQITRKYYEAAVESNLKRSIALIGNQLQQTPFNKYSDRALELSRLGEVRVTIIDSTGKVIVDSASNPAQMENHLNRPEIQAALRGESGVSKRYSRTMGYSFMYRAVVLHTEEFDGFLRLSVPLLKLKNIQNQITLLSILSIVIGSMIAVMVAIRIASAISEPIQELMEAAKDLSRGKLGRRVYVNSIDEVGMLSQTFNFMSMELEEQVNKLKDRTLKLESILSSMIEGIIAIDKDFNIMLINPVSILLFNIEKDDIIGKPILEVIRNPQIYDILESSIQNGNYAVKEIVIRNKSEKIIRVYANPIFSQAEEADIIGTLLVIEDITNIRRLEQMRSEFVSNVTHELKTPLTSIRGFVDTLRNGAIEDKKAGMRFLEIIEIEADRLQRLIQDILLLSEIENKEVSKDVNVERLSIRQVVGEVRDVLSYKLQEKDIHFHIDVEGRLPVIEMNRDRLKQVLINLLDNAINYTLEGGRIALRCFRYNNELCIEVEDNGVGIPEEHLTRIFERFYRVDKDRSRKKGGTGLGLSIVKHIVKLYNGRIDVRSQMGKGTIFCIFIPFYNEEISRNKRN